MLSLPQLSNCCCFCTLETGTTIIAYIEIVVGILGSIMVGADSSNLTYQQKNAFIAGMIVASLLNTAIGIMLLIGVKKKRLSLVQTWIIITSIMMLANAVFMVISIAMAGFSTMIFIAVLIPFFVNMYFFMIVNSYYKQELGATGIA